MTTGSFVEQVCALLLGEHRRLEGGLEIREVETANGIAGEEIVLTIAPATRALRRTGRAGTVAVPIARDWRRLSELDDPVDYIAYARRRAAAEYRPVPDAKDLARAEKHRTDVRRHLPHTALLYARLLSELRDRYGALEELDDGGALLDPEDAPWVEVHITPAQWRDLVIESAVRHRLDHGRKEADGFGLAVAALIEVIEARAQGEDFVVVDRGRFRASTRIALPAVPTPR